MLAVISRSAMSSSIMSSRSPDDEILEATDDQIREENTIRREQEQVRTPFGTCFKYVPNLFTTRLKDLLLLLGPART